MDGVRYLYIVSNSYEELIIQKLLFETQGQIQYHRLLMQKGTVMRIIAIATAIGFAAIPLPSYASVRILGIKVAKNDVCPAASTSKCVQESLGTTSTYIGSSRRYVNLDSNGTPIYSEYLGRIHNRAMAKGYGYCGNLSGSNALADFAAAKNIDYLKIPQSNAVRFSVKAKKLVSANTGLDAVAIATAAGIPTELTSDVAAAIKGSYSRTSSRELHVSGTYQFVEINPEVFAAMGANDAPPGLRTCATWLSANNSLLVASLTGYKLEKASASSELVEKFSSELTATLGAKVTPTQIASIAAAFSSEVEKKAELTFNPTFQLLSVGTTRPN
jgi:hypothetical protein